MSENSHTNDHHDDDNHGGDGHDHHHDHDHHHSHGHGHENDQGLRGMLRYLRWAPKMWSSDLNRELVDQLAPVWGETLVDIGSGMGPGAVHAAKTGATVIAVEPTPFMRRILTVRRLMQQARGNLTIVDGTAEQIPVPDGSVDVVMAVNTMHHWTDVERGVAEVGRVLRPGGRILMVDEDFQNPDHPDYERFGNDGADPDTNHHHGFTLVDAAQMGELLTAVGLVDIKAGDVVLAGRPVISVAARKAP